ncbi:MAG: (2Fe-2S) ferredoxin domain-containing protein [Bacilli bacterium]|jgi:NADH:ubiquinone oxidoreductase subunit E|nr:(2Fe-2S) ferredoxin domain-containing protein [Bacilli bacterium]
MVNVSICVGSSCHLKGSFDVIEGFRKEVADRHLEKKVELKAAFCLGKCAFDGVTIQVNDKIITGVTKDNLPSVFASEVLPLVEA